MKNFLIAVVALALTTIVVSDASAGIFNRRSRSYSQSTMSTQSAAGVRSYSYEPGAGTAMSTNGSSGRRLYSWEYPKTDSRRYNPN